MGRYFFVYVLLRAAPQRPFASVVESNDFEGARVAREFVLGAAGADLLYISNVKEGTHAERLARGEIPPQRVPAIDSHEPLHGHEAPQAVVVESEFGPVEARVLKLGSTMRECPIGTDALHDATRSNFGPEIAPEDGGPGDERRSYADDDIEPSLDCMHEARS